MPFDLLIRNGRVCDGTGLPGYRADVGVFAGRIAAIGSLKQAESAVTIDATNRIVCPGFIDAHVHGDLALLVDPEHEPAIRQGVTTYIIGQDGVAFAPAWPRTMQHMRRYTAGFNGNFLTPGRDWRTVDEFLSLFDGTTSLNVATLVPNGNVRLEVMGLESRRATRAEQESMDRLVRDGMEEGAVGLSSGLDYVPSLYADEQELTALCKAIAPYHGVYVTHMRGYSPATAPAALAEVFAIGRNADCGVHVSHFNCLAEQTIPLLEQAKRDGVDVTFDLYPYLYGSTTLAMLTLPPEIHEGGVDATLTRLGDSSTRKKLEDSFAQPRFPIETIRLANVPHPDYRHLEGKSLLEAAGNQPLVEFVCDLLVATDLAVGCIIRHFAERTQTDIDILTQHPAMMAGSDGIFCGGFPHPRGTGSFAKYLGDFVRRGVWSLETAISHLSFHAARRFGLSDRGLIRTGMAADIVVFDPHAITDRSTYENGKALAEGVEHVVVNGQLVMHQGQRTPARPGRGLRRS